MSKNALYFPYINVPQNGWFFHVLLYWDKISSIVPSDHVYNPELLEPFMRDLVAAELVEQVIPYQYISGIHKFNNSFLEYINRQIIENKIQKKRRVKNTTRIHIEKIEGIASELVKLGVARSSDYPWYAVDDWVANAFMNYLATILGKISDIDADPITDALDRFPMNVYNSTSNTQFNIKVTTTRQSLLRKLLPLPEDKIDIPTLVDFKYCNKDKLTKLRDTIEKSCIAIANIDDDQGRLNYEDIVVREFQDEINEITDAMKSKWKQINFGTLIPIIGAGATVVSSINGKGSPQSLIDTGATAISTGFSLISAVYQAIEGVQNYEKMAKKPMAYVAFAREKFSIMK